MKSSTTTWFLMRLLRHSSRNSSAYDMPFCLKSPTMKMGVLKYDWIISMSSASLCGLLYAGAFLHTTLPLASWEPPHSAQLIEHPRTVNTEVSGTLSHPAHGRAPLMSPLRMVHLIMVP